MLRRPFQLALNLLPIGFCAWLASAPVCLARPLPADFSAGSEWDSAASLPSLEAELAWDADLELERLLADFRPPESPNRALAVARPVEGIVRPGIVDYPTLQKPSSIQTVGSRHFESLTAWSDLHGRNKAAGKLLRGAALIDSQGDWTARNALAIFNGDVINKGRRSVELLDRMIQLTRQAPHHGSQLIVTLGNHEASLLAAADQIKARARTAKGYDPDTVEEALVKKYLHKRPELHQSMERMGVSWDELTSPLSERGAFLRSMPVGVRAGDALFIHAGAIPYFNSLEWDDFVYQIDSIVSRSEYGAHWLMNRKDSLLNADDWVKEPELAKRVISQARKWGIRYLIVGHRADLLGRSERTNIAARILTHEGYELVVIKTDTGMGHPGKISKGEYVTFSRRELIPPRPTDPSEIRVGDRGGTIGVLNCAVPLFKRP